MKYHELYTEYRQLLNEEVQLRRQLEELPCGSLTIKRISGREYHYLQNSENGKKSSEYIKADRLKIVREQLELRAEYTQRLEEVGRGQQRLEAAAQILDAALSKLFFHTKTSFKMDALPVKRRQKALEFATAMTALEGIPAAKETDLHLQAWADGSASFSDYYLTSLQKYRILEVQP